MSYNYINLVANLGTKKSNALDLKKYFQRVNSLSFVNTFAADTYLHLYFGLDLVTDCFYVFLLTESADAAQDYSNVLTFPFPAPVTGMRVAGDKNVATVDPSNKSGNATKNATSSPYAITTSQAAERVFLWTTNKDAFVEQSAARTVGVVRAFEIPCTYLVSSRTYTLFLGLQQSGTTYTPDVILRDQTDMSYYNMSRPVPPFGKGLTHNFKLITN